MSIISFIDWTHQKNENPLSREAIKAETYYFYKCAIDSNADFTNKAGYSEENFIEYQKQFALAQQIILGIENIDKYDIPQEVKHLDFSKIQIDIIALIINLNTASEIKLNIEKYTDKLLKSDKQKQLGEALKKLTESEEFKQAYKNADVNSFKLFVMKCIYIIKGCIMFCFSTQNMKQIKESYNDSIKVYAKTEEVKTFKDFIRTKMTEPQQNLVQ